MFFGYSKERTIARWRKLKRAKSITHASPKNSVRRKRTEVRPLQGDTIPFFHMCRTPVDSSSSHLEHSQARSVPIRQHAVVDDLIVAKEHVSPDFVIDQFDLTMCMLSFDGTTFKVPFARHVFRTNKDTGFHEPSSLLCRNKNELSDFLKGDYFFKDSGTLSTHGRLQAMEWETERFDNAHRFLKFLWNRGYDFGNTNEERTTIRPPPILLAIPYIENKTKQKERKSIVNNLFYVSIPPIHHESPLTWHASSSNYLSYETHEYVGSWDSRTAVPPMHVSPAPKPIPLVRNFSKSVDLVLFFGQVCLGMPKTFPP